jgi:hypothetical protein
MPSRCVGKVVRVWKVERGCQERQYIYIAILVCVLWKVLIVWT